MKGVIVRTPEPKINDYDICYDYIVRCRYYLEDHWTFDEEDLEHKITNAEIDLMEMEIQMIADAEEYDALVNGNVFRSSKRAQRRKANIRHHKADRKHGKTVPQSDKKYWDEQSGTFYRWDEKRKTFHSHKKPVIHRKRKTFRNRLEFAAKEREIDFLSAMEICDRSNVIYFRGVKETNPIRKEQLMDIASDLLNAGCVDFYHGTVTGHKGTYFPDLAVGV